MILERGSAGAQERGRDKDVEVVLADERIVLLPERAMFWPGASTLFVADPHFGKAAAFRAAGIPVPRGTTGDALVRLDAMLGRTQARRIVFLGDLLHAREGRAPETLRVLGEWRDRHAAIELLLVRGNHDRRAGDPPSSLDIACVDAPVVESPFVLTHHPAPSPEGHVLSGHLHPGVKLVGPGRQYERLPGFWLGGSRGVTVLPAFGDFTGLADVDPAPDDRVFVIAEGTIMSVR